ncbi:MAG: S9 family peptidase [Actinobacteria bacterium]|nr:S9 family peptidase [Actinomycetota bacterium]
MGITSARLCRILRGSGRFPRPPSAKIYAVLASGPSPRITAALCARGRTVADPRLSPTGDRVALVATAAGRSQLVVIALHAAGAGAAGPEVVVSSEPPPCPARPFGGGVFDWLPDGSALVYAASDGGLWLQPVTGAPPRRLVEHGPAAAPAVSPDGTLVAYVVDGRHVALAPVDDDRWWPVRLSSTADFCFDPTWSPDGSWVAWHEWDVPAMPWDTSRIVLRAVDGGGSVVVAAGGDGVAVQQPRFSPDGLLGYLSDESGWSNLWVVGRSLDDPRPLVDEPREHGGPAWGQGQRSYAWSPDGDAVALCRNEDGFGSLQVFDRSSGGLVEVGRGVHGSLSWQGHTLAALRSGARSPTAVVAYGEARLGGEGFGERTTLAHGPLAGLSAAPLVEPEVVGWSGDDGAEIPGRLYRPCDAVLGDPPPLIAWVHGGPTGQMEASFNARISYWVERGWAVLVPDHRGSTGHGRAFTQALAGRWGELDVSDTAAGLRTAVESGWGHRRRLVAMGASAGGFTVLHLLAAHPDLCAAGVDLYGVADLLAQDETPDRFEAHYLHSLVGPLPEAADLYRSRSPLRRVEAIVAPLLILHGGADTVVSPAQSQAVADRLRALGRTVEHHVFEGERHGWSRPETVIDELGRTEGFLRRHVLRWRAP